jgi:hypothetical protein
MVPANTHSTHPFATASVVVEFSVSAVSIIDAEVRELGASPRFRSGGRSAYCPAAGRRRRRRVRGRQHRGRVALAGHCPDCRADAIKLLTPSRLAGDAKCSQRRRGASGSVGRGRGHVRGWGSIGVWARAHREPRAASTRRGAPPDEHHIFQCPIGVATASGSRQGREAGDAVNRFGSASGDQPPFPRGVLWGDPLVRSRSWSRWRTLFACGAPSSSNVASACCQAWRAASARPVSNSALPRL